MAGGPNAKVVMCIHCTGKAIRTYEGSETDWYLCKRCGRAFGIDWEGGGGQPDKPCWPPSRKEIEAAKTFLAARAAHERRQSGNEMVGPEIATKTAASPKRRWWQFWK
jgi:hypothetical protein